MKNRHILALVVCMGISLTQTASAQDIVTRGNVATRSDMVTMKAIGIRLYKRDGAEKGASEVWQNAKSGHHGRITVLDVFERGGAPCRKVHYETIFDAVNKTSYVITWCRTPEGEWKIP